jgi:hypothetical protein
MKPGTGDSRALRRRQLRRSRLAAVLLLALLAPRRTPAGRFDDLVPDRPPSPPPWAEAVKAFDASPLTVAYLVENRQFQTGTCLVTGARPKDDRPSADHPLIGKPAAGDWVFEDGTAAIRVTGVPPPEPGRPIVLAARLGPASEPALLGLRVMTAGNPRGATVVGAGDFVHFSLPATKSYSTYVEFSGDVAAIESLALLHGLIVRGVRSGTVRGKVFAQWWNRPEPEPRGELTVEVKALVDAGPKAPGRRWLRELTGADGVGFTAYPTPLGWQSDHPDSYPAAFLVIGTRPQGDRAPAGLKLHGKRRAAGDWVVADASGAIWVSGLPAPDPAKPVLLAGRFSTESGVTSLDGIRFLVAGDRKEGTTVRAGEFVYFPLAGNKSTTCPVEVDGDAAEVAFTDQRDALIVRAVKPGVARIKVFSHRFDDDEAIPTGELLVTVR